MDNIIGLQVYVYFNLHKKVFSIKALQGSQRGRVIGYSSHVLLADAVPKVSEAGRQRVIREGRKKVHAGMVGTVIALGELDATGEPVTYNPYKYSSFVHLYTAEPVTERGTYYLHNKRITKVEEYQL